MVASIQWSFHIGHMTVVNIDIIVLTIILQLVHTENYLMMRIQGLLFDGFQSDHNLV